MSSPPPPPPSNPPASAAYSNAPPPAIPPHPPTPHDASTLTPRRLREAHAHIAAFGESLSLLDLSACGSVQACLETIAAHTQRAARHDPRRVRDGWVLAFGARVESWTERRWPSLAELDAASGSGAEQVPCVIKSFDHHAACANSSALELAGLRAGDRVEPNGVVVADSLGRPTGVLLEHAAFKAWNTAPTPTMNDRKTHVLTALRSLAAMGYVEVHDMLSQPWLGPIMRELEADGTLPMESVWLYPPVEDFEGAAQAWESDRVRPAGAKLFADGTLNSRTALMLHDYRDPLPEHPRGQAMASAEQIDAALRKVSSASSLREPRFARGHLSVHAIGDGAVRAVLDAVQRVKPRADVLGLTARIEHCELIDAADVPRFAALGVVASVQPCHLLYDVEALTRYLPHRLDRVLPVRSLLESGCTPGMLAPETRRDRRSRGEPCGEVWFGSDVPIVRANAADSITAATRGAVSVNRVLRDSAPGPSLHPRFGELSPREAIGAREAWACFEA